MIQVAQTWPPPLTSLYEDMILSMASAPDTSRLRAVVNASVRSLTITWTGPSTTSTEGERHRETEGERGRERHKETETETQREQHRGSNTERGRETDRQETERERERQIYGYGIVDSYLDKLKLHRYISLVYSPNITGRIV